MKTNGVPAIIMLAAGFIDCVIAIYAHVTLEFYKTAVTGTCPVLCDRLCGKNDH